MAQATVSAAYNGPIKLGMVFDYEPGKKHLYERLAISKLDGPHIWAFGRSGETYYEEADFRKSVVLVSETSLVKPRPVPAPFVKRYEGPIEIGMFFDYEPGKKHLYERLCVTKRQGIHIWARGRGGESYHEEDDFRNSVVPVAGENR